MRASLGDAEYIAIIKLSGLYSLGNIECTVLVNLLGLKFVGNNAV